MKQIQIDLPEYTVEKDPKYDVLGEKVDSEIINHLPEGNYIVRAISSNDHEISRKELISKIKELGTDKYDPTRKPIAHDEFKNYDYDIQASELIIKNDQIITDPEDECNTMFGQIIYDFYLHAPYDRGYSVRIDLLMIYDGTQLIPAQKKTEAADNFKPGLEKYLYKFRDPHKIKESLLAIVEIR